MSESLYEVVNRQMRMKWQHKSCRYCHKDGEPSGHDVAIGSFNAGGAELATITCNRCGAVELMNLTTIRR